MFVHMHASPQSPACMSAAYVSRSVLPPNMLLQKISNAQGAGLCVVAYTGLPFRRPVARRAAMATAKLSAQPNASSAAALVTQLDTTTACSHPGQTTLSLLQTLCCNGCHHMTSVKACLLAQSLGGWLHNIPGC